MRSLWYVFETVKHNVIVNETYINSSCIKFFQSRYSNTMSDDRLVAVLNDKDNFINLGLHHVQQLRVELDLARLQIEDLQKASIVPKVSSEIYLLSHT